MQEFVANYSRWRLALMLLGSVGFVVDGMWLAGAFGPPQGISGPPLENEIWGWICIVFFGASTLAILKLLMDGGVKLRVGISGIYFAKEMLTWSEITEVGSYQVKQTRMITLKLRDPKRMTKTAISKMLASINRVGFGCWDCYISLGGTNRSFKEAMAAIEHFRPATPATPH